MVKAIESFGIPAVHVCTIVPISETVGANRILPSVAIPYPTGNPALSRDEEVALRKKMMTKALEALKTKITEQTVF
jgi:glycine reductase complex component B subunit gamma